MAATELIFQFGHHDGPHRIMSVPAAQCPVPPEIEGYLYKMKRKTGINLTGSWNKRWFYVDVKRKEFGYSVSHSQPIMKSSIFLDDITAIVVFDDYCFQVESKGRKFFLKGESKAGAAVWVKTLETYRSQFVAYEKYMASTPIYTPPPPKTADVKSNNGSLGTPSSGPVKTDHAARKTNQRAEDKQIYKRAKEAKTSSSFDHSTPVQAWSKDDDEDDLDGHDDMDIH